MKYFPAENITYKTKLKEVEVLKRLADLIEPKKPFRISLFGNGARKPYEGDISGLTFNIRRIIGYKNSFLPKISGVIQQEFDGTSIQVKMRMNIFVTAFMCVWLGGVLFAGLAVFIGTLGKGAKTQATTLIPVGMFMAGYGITLGGFKYESKKAIKDLQALFEAEIINP